MKSDGFAVVAVTVLLVLAGCVGGGPTDSGTTTGTTAGETATTTTTHGGTTTATTRGETTIAAATNGEATDATNTESARTSTDGPVTTSTTESAGASTTGPATTDRATSAVGSNGSRSFGSHGVATNYSAGGDLDAEQVVRTHLEALDRVESVTVLSTTETVTQTETGESSSVQHLRTERNATHRFHRQNGTGFGFAAYRGPDLAAMKVTGDDGTNHFRIGGGDGGGRGDGTGSAGRQAPNASESYALALAKLQTMPYEKVGTVERNGTTLVEYEATGPGYYAARGNVTVESFASTVLVGPDGLVRYFHHEVAYRSDGRSHAVETTVQYRDVGTTDVTVPDWLDEVRSGGDE